MLLNLTLRAKSSKLFTFLTSKLLRTLVMCRCSIWRRPSWITQVTRDMTGRVLVVSHTAVLTGIHCNVVEGPRRASN